MNTSRLSLQLCTQGVLLGAGTLNLVFVTEVSPIRGWLSNLWWARLTVLLLPPLALAAWIALRPRPPRARSHGEHLCAALTAGVGLGLYGGRATALDRVTFAFAALSLTLLLGNALLRLTWRQPLAHAALGSVALLIGLRYGWPGGTSLAGTYTPFLDLPNTHRSHLLLAASALWICGWIAGPPRDPRPVSLPGRLAALPLLLLWTLNPPLPLPQPPPPPPPRIRRPHGGCRSPRTHDVTPPWPSKSEFQQLHRTVETIFRTWLETHPPSHPGLLPPRETLSREIDVPAPWGLRDLAVLGPHPLARHVNTLLLHRRSHPIRPVSRNYTLNQTVLYGAEFRSGRDRPLGWAVTRLRVSVGEHHYTLQLIWSINP